MSSCVTSDLPSGSGVQDAARGPSPAADGGSGPQTPVGDAQRPAAQIHPEQTGRAAPGQGDALLFYGDTPSLVSAL